MGILKEAEAILLKKQKKERPAPIGEMTGLFITKFEKVKPLSREAPTKGNRRLKWQRHIPRLFQ